jgi:hypothetical protein
MKYIIWLFSALLSIAFIGSGVAKVVGVPEVMSAFQTLGLPSWFPLFLAVAYFIGAVLIWVPKYAALAAGGFTLVMVGAVGYHIVFTPVAEAVPAAVLLVLSVFIFVQRRGQAFWAA